MPTKKVLYEGKAKQLIKGPNKDTLIQIFKDDATAYTVSYTHLTLPTKA